MATYTEYQQRLLDQDFEKQQMRREVNRWFLNEWKRQLEVQLEFEFMRELPKQTKGAR